MRFTVLLSSFLFTSPFLFAQYKAASTSTTDKKTVVVTAYDKGYVVKTNGQRLEGKIQLKVVNNDTLEIRLKDDAKNKFKFKRFDLESFGLTSMIADAKEAKFPAKNFHSGYIITETGEKREGKVALRFTMVEGDVGVRYFAKRVLFDVGGGEYKTYTAENGIKEIVQNIDGEKNVYELYKDGFTKHIRAGALVLMQNPYSTSTNDLASGLISEVQEDLAEEAAKATLKQEMKKGSDGNLQNVVDNYDAVKSADISVARKEYLVRQEGSTQMTILQKDSYKNWAEQLFATCSAYQRLEKGEQRQKLRWNNVVEAIEFYNQSCN